MKKFLGFLGALVIAFSLTACGISEKTAEKIKVAAAKDEHWTYAEVIEKLDAPTLDATVEVFGFRAGAMTWYVGYESYDEAKAAVEAGKTVKVLVVTIVDGKATDANYSEWAKEEK